MTVTLQRETGRSFAVTLELDGVRHVLRYSRGAVVWPAPVLLELGELWAEAQRAINRAVSEAEGENDAR